jgi:anaerobic selenocysteine-containing dehydrogenase
VHELFLTDTARYADIVLPATSQLEQVDVHKPYGHLSLQYNAQAIEPLGEARSNWDVMRALATALGFNEPWLHDDAEAVIREVLAATAVTNPRAKGLTLERLQAEGTIPFSIADEERTPFANGIFRTPSGKVEMYSAQAAAKGYDPVPDWVPEVETRKPRKLHRISSEAFDAQSPDEALPLLCPAAHHFVSSTFANLDTMKTKEHEPTLRIHPHDAEIRNIRHGQPVRISNERGSCQLVACVTEDVCPGMLATTTVWWPQHSPDQRNVNWTTPDRLADFAGGSTFYTNLVTVEAI